MTKNNDKFIIEDDLLRRIGEVLEQTGNKSLLNETHNLDMYEDKKINIPFSEEDLQELQNGETFDWTFDGVDCHIYMGYDDNDGQDCTKCGLPIQMYACKKCEDIQEQDNFGVCIVCGGEVELDKEYHNNCD